MSEDSDTGSDADGLESTPLGVGDDTTKDGDDVGQELEHRVDSGSLDRPLAESTGGLLFTSLAGGDSTGAVSSWRESTSDEILENVLTSVVRCPLAQLDEAHGDTDPADGSRDPGPSA